MSNVTQIILVLIGSGTLSVLINGWLNRRHKAATVESIAVETYARVNEGVNAQLEANQRRCNEEIAALRDELRDVRIENAQLRQQDPINPVGDKEFIGQIAQLTSVEQLTKMSSALDRVDFGNQVNQAVGLLGKTITWDDGNGWTGEGVADSLAFDGNGGIILRVAGQDVAPGIVKAVR